MQIPVTLVEAPGGAELTPGLMFEWPTDSAPTGFLLCDGTVYNVADYPALGALLVAYAAFYGGNGTTTFGVPDKRGRVGVGKGTNTDVDQIGENDGAALANRRVKHKHTVVQPTIGITDNGHGHAFRYHDQGTTFSGLVAMFAATNAQSRTQADVTPYSEIATDTVATATTGITAAASAGTVGPQATSPDDGPSFLVVNFIIKT